MANDTSNTFIVDCPQCRAKVAAIENGVALRKGVVHEGEAYYGERLAVGKCPKCRTLLAGESLQTAIEQFDAEEDEWTDFVRVFPKPSKAFMSHRIPSSVVHSIDEANKSIQASANTAACVMLGRAFEGVCKDHLEPSATGTLANATVSIKKRPIMLGEGIRKMKEQGLIDERLFEWSQQLQIFRNSAAHATDTTISREDAEDLQSFVYAIIEYVYDLTDRYNEFKARVAKRNKKS